LSPFFFIHVSLQKTNFVFSLAVSDSRRQTVTFFRFRKPVVHFFKQVNLSWARAKALFHFFFIRAGFRKAPSYFSLLKKRLGCFGKYFACLCITVFRICAVVFINSCLQKICYKIANPEKNQKMSDETLKKPGAWLKNSGVPLKISGVCLHEWRKVKQYRQRDNTTFLQVSIFCF